MNLKYLRQFLLVIPAIRAVPTGFYANDNYYEISNAFDHLGLDAFGDRQPLLPYDQTYSHGNYGPGGHIPEQYIPPPPPSTYVSNEGQPAYRQQFSYIPPLLPPLPPPPQFHPAYSHPPTFAPPPHHSYDYQDSPERGPSADYNSDHQVTPSSPYRNTASTSNTEGQAANSAMEDWPKIDRLASLSKNNDKEINPSKLKGFSSLPKGGAVPMESEVLFLWELGKIHNEWIKKGEWDYFGSRFFDPNDPFYRALVLYCIRKPRQGSGSEIILHGIHFDGSYLDKKKWAKEVVQWIKNDFKPPPIESYTKELIKSLSMEKNPTNKQISQEVVEALITGDWDRWSGKEIEPVDNILDYQKEGRGERVDDDE